MAFPPLRSTCHVCGVLLATGGNQKADGYVAGDPDGDADSIVHE